MIKQLKDVALTIGHNVGNVPTWNTKSVCTTAAAVLGIDGLTAYTVRGVWQGAYEESTRIEICGVDNAAELLQRVEALATALHQEYIMCNVTDSQTRFIGATVTENTAIL